MINRIGQHPLVNTLKHLRANQKVCVFTEPLWGIPFNLFSPYAALYMAALGLEDSAIGIVASINMGFQIVFALLSGIITDKLGRKRTTFIFDTLSWSIPCLIWALSQSFAYFAVAAAVNGMARITMNSWNLVLVEDCEEEQLVHVWAWIHMAGFLAAFFAPLAGLLIRFYGLVPTVRGLYVFGFIFMTIKFLVFNHFAVETKQGQVRMQETQRETLSSMFRQYKGVMGAVLKSPKTLLALGLMMVMTITVMINLNFWPLLVTSRLDIPVEWIGIFPFVRSAVMLAFYFTLTPRLHVNRFRNPMLWGFGLFSCSQLLLITAPIEGMAVVLVSVLLEAVSLSLLDPLISSIIVIAVDFRERARIMALIHTAVLVCTSPFGWLAGSLSEVHRTLPFMVNIGLFALGIVLTLVLDLQRQKKPAVTMP